MKKLYLSLGLFVICAAACSKKSSTTTAAAEDSVTIETLALSSLNLTQKSDATTPAGFKAGTSLSLASASDICNTKFPADGSGARPSQYYACLGAYDVRQRFFQAGPTVIRERLKSVDDRLNGYLTRTQTARIPCFDPSNLGGTDSILKEGATEEGVYPAYELKTFGTSTTFSDKTTLDFGRSYSFSCWDHFGDSSAFDIYMGRKDSTWYLAEVQTPGSAASADSIKALSLLKVDADDNMEVLFAIGTKTLAANTDANPETLSASAINALYNQSAGFAQFVVRPKEGIYGAVAVMNYACEQRLVMNDTAAYVEVNGNSYGHCFANDVWVGNSDFSTPAYSADKTNSKVCLKVTGTLPEPQDDLSLCESAGLLVSDENGGYIDPFKKYGIMNLTTNVANPPSNGFGIRAYQATRLLPDIGSGTPALKMLEIPPTADVKIKGFSAISLALTKSSSSADADDASLSAACNAAEAARKQSFTQAFELSIADYITAMTKSAPTGTTSDTILEGLNTALARTGETAPAFKARLSRRIGTTFHSVGSGTVTVKYDGTTIGTATLDQSTLAADVTGTDISINLNPAPTATATGKFTVEYSGKTVLECNNAISTVRTANSFLGNPSVLIFNNVAE